MIGRIFKILWAKYQALWWLSWRSSPRPDVIAGLQRWKWMACQRRDGRWIDPSLEIRCEGELGSRLQIGLGSAVDKGGIIWLAGDDSRIELGKKVYVGPHCYLGSHQRLEIGDDTIIGAYSYVITCNHRFDRRDVPIHSQGYAGDDIWIGKNVWIGCHVVVLPGVIIGDGAVVGAGSIVTRSIPAGQVWVGAPAKFLKER